MKSRADVKLHTRSAPSSTCPGLECRSPSTSRMRIQEDILGPQFVGVILGL